MPKPKSVKPDREIVDPKSGPRYKVCLRSAALAFIKSFELIEETGDKSLSWHRLLGAVPQHPIEHGHGNLRYEHSRWRHSSVTPDNLPKNVHVEHPFRKELTKQIIYKTWNEMKQNGSEKEEIVSKIEHILDERADTILMPSQKLKPLGVTGNGLPKSDGTDGWERYRKLIKAGEVIDRLTGSPTSFHDLGLEE